MNIPFTPTESIFHGTTDIWNVLRTTKLNEELALRHRILGELFTPVDPNKSRIDILRPVYESLTTLLTHHPRLFLYLPSTLIPHSSERHDPTIANYISALLHSFQTLLPSYEPRANITNGDEPSPLISPAAIIARTLVHKELLHPEWATLHDKIIQDSYTDTLQVTLPAEDPTNPKRDAWLKWEHQRLAAKAQPNLELGEYDAKEWTQPNLEGPLSSNLTTSAAEIQRLQTLVTTDPELKKLIYPIIILYGSRLKGYGSTTSDLDTAVFIRPINYGHSIHQTENLIRSKIPGTTVYWLIENGPDIHIYDFELETDATASQRGAPYDAHVLFNGVWIGDPESQQFLCDHLLKPITKLGPRTKAVLRRELERDLLQYRLLHRGYETFHQTIGPTFIDDGYRWLATKLYLKYIFLP